MNLGDWCPVLITDPVGEYWGIRLMCFCERTMGRWEFSQSSKTMYLRIFSQHHLRTRPGLFAVRRGKWAFVILFRLTWITHSANL